MLNKQVDYKLFFTVFALIVFGAIMVSSVSVYTSSIVTTKMVNLGLLDQPYNYFYVIRNLTHIFVGLFLLLFLVKIPFNVYEKYSKHIIIIAILMMLYVLINGQILLGATRWIVLPLFTIQPSEFFKFAIIVFLAYYFKKNASKIKTFQYGFLPFLGMLLIPVVLLGLQPDFGSVFIIGFIMVSMFFIAGARFKYIFIFFLLGIFLVISVYNIGKYDHSLPNTKTKLSYVTDRIDNFLQNEKEQITNKTINYQTKQGLIAIGSGGFSGLGFGSSIQKFGYLPEVQGDFIFSVIIEELGFIGGCVLFLFYFYIGYRGFYISRHSVDLFAKYASFGVTTRILIQAFVNIGVNLNVLPLTGLTLPFISYGGSSILSLLLGLGLLLSISREVDEKSTKLINSRSNINLYLENKQN